MKLEKVKSIGSNCRGCGEKSDTGIKITYFDNNSQVLNLCEKCQKELSFFLKNKESEKNG